MKEKIAGRKNRKKYSAEFKDKALALSDKVGQCVIHGGQNEIKVVSL